MLGCSNHQRGLRRLDELQVPVKLSEHIGDYLLLRHPHEIVATTAIANKVRASNRNPP